MAIINRSNELRKIILQQAERFNIPITHLCRRVVIDYHKFLDYANQKDLSKGNIRIKDHQLVAMAKLLGVDVRMVIVIKSEDECREEVLFNKNALKNEYEKKGTPTEAKPADTEAGSDVE